VVRHFVRFLILVATLTAASCAPSLHNTSAPTAAEIPQLEAQVRADSTSVASLVRLGAAYRAAGRLPEARTTLERAHRLAPSDGGAALYLGLTYEDLSDVAAARRLYETYLRTGTDAATKDAVRRRIPALERLELQVAVRQAIAQESSLNARPAATTVAVFPFSVAATDSSLQPLGRALAELLVSDLGVTGRIRVVERTQVQLLLDELELAASRYVDPATGARGGRLLGAGRIVQGQVQGDTARLRLNAAVVRTETGAATRLDRLNTQGALAQLFDIEKRLALMIHEQLNVQLTAAERERLLAHRTNNIQALLEYGLALEASDNGRYEEAARHYRAAARLDPGFEAAATEAARAEQLSQAPAGTNEIAALGAREAALPLEPFNFDELIAVRDALVPEGPERNQVAEVLGREGFARTAVLINLIFRRPE
jgi:TolB-like protein